MIDTTFILELADGSVIHVQATSQGEPIVLRKDLPKDQLPGFSDRNLPNGAKNPLSVTSVTSNRT